MNYYEFLKSKIVKVEKSGIDIDADEVNPNLLPHQRDAVIWAVKGGRRALFENFGLGKTVQQLEWCRLLTKHEGGKALIVLPLGVKQEFKRDAVELLGMEEPQYITSMEQVRNSNNNRLPASFMVVAPGSWNDEVWDDINRMRTLNTTQSHKNQQMHVCPLQIDIVERIINRYSNKGDLIFDPFAGLFTVPLVAIKMGRRGIGTELNPDYFRDGLGYLKQEEDKKNQVTMFDLLGG